MDTERSKLEPQPSQELLTPKQELGLGVAGVVGGTAIALAGVEVNAPIEMFTGLAVVGLGIRFALNAIKNLRKSK